MLYTTKSKALCLPFENMASDGALCTAATLAPNLHTAGKSEQAEQQQPTDTQECVLCHTYL